MNPSYSLLGQHCNVFFTCVLADLANFVNWKGVYKRCIVKYCIYGYRDKEKYKVIVLYCEVHAKECQH